jgi:hypothetical protein
LGGTGQNPHPWLADHVIFFGYRWLSWAATGLLLLALENPATYIWLLVVTGVLNLLVTLFAQRYVRAAHHNPAIMSLDVLYAVLILLAHGGWNSPFVFYAYSSLVLPALLFGWRGGIMAGLSFAALGPAALWAANVPMPGEWLLGNVEGSWTGLALIMVAPPIFGCVLPAVVELLRRAAARQAQRRAARRPPLVDDLVERQVPTQPTRFASITRDPARRRESGLTDAPLAVQATKIRAAEPSVEDLRRVLFAPFPTPEGELSTSLELLSQRFGQHTGATTRVTLLGRTRVVHPIHRSLLIRLAQEALLNIQQHAHGSTATLTLRYDAASVVLLIQDNGIGLLDGTYERPGLHALRAMNYRLAEFGGRLDVFETEGGGVTVRATMPLE